MADSYPIEKQACLLEQAKELAELLGEHAPESYFGWGLRKRNGEAKIGYKKYLEGMEASHGSITVYRAYTGDELGALLPKKIKTRHSKYIKSFEYECKEWSVFYAWYSSYSNDCERKFLFISAYEAHAKADLLIYLLKKKIIKPEDLTYA